MKSCDKKKKHLNQKIKPLDILQLCKLGIGKPCQIHSTTKGKSLLQELCNSSSNNGHQLCFFGSNVIIFFL